MQLIRLVLSLTLSLGILFPQPFPFSLSKQPVHLAPESSNPDFLDLVYASLTRRLEAKMPADAAFAELQAEFGADPRFLLEMPTIRYWIGMARGYFTPADLPGVEFDANTFRATVGDPGKFPFTRSVTPKGLQQGLTIRKYWSKPTPQETNGIFKEVLKAGGSPSMAFDLTTQLGLDPDEDESPFVEVGGSGVSMFRLEDYEAAFDGIDPTEVTSNFTINGPAMFVVAAYEAMVRKRFAHLPPDELNKKLEKVRGTIQNDVYKEYVARDNFIFPLGGTEALFADFAEHSQRTLTAFRLVSVCGYHMREKECSPSQEMAYAISNALQYITVCLREKKELDPNKFVPLFSFFFNSKQAGSRIESDGTRRNLSLLTEAAKIRAGRRIWARLMRDALKLTNPRAHSMLVMNYSGGTESTKSKMELTLARIAIQSLASLLGTPLGTNSYSADESIDIPGVFYGILSVLIDRITLEERGVKEIIDPAGGASYLEALTDQMEAEIWNELKVMAAKPSYQDVLAHIVNATDETSSQMEKAIQSSPETPGFKPVVGRNIYQEGAEAYPTQVEQAKEVILPGEEMAKEKARIAERNKPFDPPELTSQQRERLATLPEKIRHRVEEIEKKLQIPNASPWAKRRLVDLRDHLIARDNARVEALLGRLEEAARTRKENLMDVTVEAVLAGATIGEWRQTLAQVFGLAQVAVGKSKYTYDNGPWSSRPTENGVPAVTQKPSDVFNVDLRKFILDVMPPETKLDQGLARNYFVATDTAFGKGEPVGPAAEYPYARGTSAAPYEIEARSPRAWTDAVQDPLVAALLAKPSLISATNLPDRVAIPSATGDGREDAASLDGFALSEAGASAAEEVAYLIYEAQALAQTYRNHYGFSPESTLSKISLTLGVGDDLLTEVAKFRVARQVWAKRNREEFELDFNNSALKLKIHARTAHHVLSKHHSWANAARVAQQAMLAAWGGADSIECAPFDAPFRTASQETEWSDWADQMALDTARLIKLEAGADGVRDPLGGSPALEARTAALAREVNYLLDRFEKLGPDQVQEEMRRRLEKGRIARQKRKRVGEEQAEGNYTPKLISVKSKPVSVAPPAKIKLVRPRSSSGIPSYRSFLEGEIPDWQRDLVQQYLEQNGFATDPQNVSLWIERVRGELISQNHHSKSVRVVTAKIGSDGHDRGIKYVNMVLRDAGLEVIYLGLRVGVKELANAVTQEDADLVGLSTPHALKYLNEFKEELRRTGSDPEEVGMMTGGAIPLEDQEKLEQMGIPVFGPETSADDIVFGIQRYFFTRALQKLVKKSADLPLSSEPTPPAPPVPSFLREYEAHPQLYWPPGLLGEMGQYCLQNLSKALSIRRVKSVRIERDQIEESAIRGGLFFKGMGMGFELSWPNGYKMLMAQDNEESRKALPPSTMLEVHSIVPLGDKNVLIALWRDSTEIKAGMRKLFDEDPATFFADPIRDTLPPRFKAIQEEVSRARNGGNIPNGKRAADFSPISPSVSVAVEKAEKIVDTAYQARLDALFEEAFAILDKAYLNLKVWQRWNIARTNLPQTRLSPRQIIYESGLFNEDQFVELNDPKNNNPTRKVSHEENMAFCEKLGLSKPETNEKGLSARTKLQKRDAARKFLEMQMTAEEIRKVLKILGLSEKESLKIPANLELYKPEAERLIKKMGLADIGELIQILVAHHEVQFDDPSVIATLARYRGPNRDRNQSVLVIGVEKGFTNEERIRTGNSGYIRPRGVRKIIRAVRLAEMLRLPVIFLNDSTGAWVGVEADYDDQGQAISRLITVQFDKRIPGISIITGEAGSAPILATSIDECWMLGYAFRNTSNPDSQYIFERMDRDVRRKFDLPPREELEEVESLPDSDPRKLPYMQFKKRVIYEIADAVAGLPSENLKNGQVYGIIPEPMFGGLRDRETLFANIGKTIDQWLDRQKNKTVEQIDRERRAAWRWKKPLYGVHPNPPKRKYLDKNNREEPVLSIRARLKQLTGKEDFDEELNAGLTTYLTDYYKRIPSLRETGAGEDTYKEDLAKDIEKTGNLCGVATGWAHINGHKVMLMVREPYFRGGSKAGVEGEKMTLALEAAIDHYDRTGERIPVVMITTGAGARSADQVWGMEELAKNNAVILEAQRRGIPVIDVASVYVLGGCAASTYPAATITLAETCRFIDKSGESKVFEPMNAFVGPPASDSLEHVPDSLKRITFRNLTHKVDAIVEREELPTFVGRLIDDFRQHELKTDDPELLMRFPINTQRWVGTYKRGKAPFQDRPGINTFAWRESEVLKKESENSTNDPRKRNWRVQKSGSSDKRYRAHFNLGITAALQSRKMPMEGHLFSSRYDFDRQPALLIREARKLLIDNVAHEQKVSEGKAVMLGLNQFSRARDAEELRRMIQAAVESEAAKKAGLLVEIIDAGPSPNALEFWYGQKVSFDRFPDKEALEYYNRVVELARNRMFAEMKRIFDELGYDVQIQKKTEKVTAWKEKIHRRLAQRRINLLVQNPNFGVEFYEEGYKNEQERGTQHCIQVANAYVIVAQKRVRHSPVQKVEEKVHAPKKKFKLLPGEFLGKNVTIPVGIAGVATQIPSRYLTNEELVEEAKRVSEAMKARGEAIEEGRLFNDPNSEAMKVTRIKSRYWFDPEKDIPAKMAADALLIALSQAGIPIEKIGSILRPWMIAVATYPAGNKVISPGVGPLVNRFLGLNLSYPSISTDAVCPGWVAAVAHMFFVIGSGGAEVGLIPVAEWYSRFLRPDSGSSWPVFGDMAAGTVLAPADSGYGILWGIYQTDGKVRDIKALARGKPIGKVTLAEIIETPLGGHFKMHGQAVGAMATESGFFMVNRALEAMDYLGLGDNINNIDWFIFHQANKGLILQLATILKIPEEKLLFTVEEFANTSAASIPATLHKHSQELQPGQLVFMGTFGGGFQWGGLLVRWGGSPSQELKSQFQLTSQAEQEFEVAI